MYTNTILLTCIAVVVGFAVPMQAGVNATVARFYGSSLLAGITNTLVATVLLAAFAVAMRVNLPQPRAIAEAPWWAWSGGIFGATMVFSSIVIAPRLGAAAYVSAMLVGTMTASLTIDHFGMMAFKQTPLTLTRAGRPAGGRGDAVAATQIAARYPQ